MGNLAEADGAGDASSTSETTSPPGTHPERPRASCRFRPWSRSPTRSGFLPDRRRRCGVLRASSSSIRPSSTLPTPHRRRPGHRPREEGHRRARRNSSKAGAGVTGHAGVPPGTLVTAHFQPIHRLMAGAPGADRRRSGRRSARFETAAQASVRRWERPIQSRHCRTPPFSILQRTAAGAEQLCRRRSARWSPQIGAKPGGSVRSRRDERAREPLSSSRSSCPCACHGRRALPIQRRQRDDVPLADFGEVFGHGGLFDTVLQADNIEKLVDTVAAPVDLASGLGGTRHRGCWSIRTGGRIREMFFRRVGKTPQLAFLRWRSRTSITPRRGSILEHRRSTLRRVGPAAEADDPVVWPGRSSGSCAVAYVRGLPAAAPSRRRIRGAVGLVQLIDWRLAGTAESRRCCVQDDITQAQVTVEAASATSNPFARTRLAAFRCGS